MACFFIGYEVTLRVGDEEFGTATVGDDGNWKIEPDADLPGGTRFDATVTQVAGEDTQSVTVPDLGIELADVTVTMPEDGDDVSDDVVFTGTSFPGASIELSIEGAVAPSDDVSPSSDFNAASGEFGPAEDEADEGASQGSWEGEFEIDEDGNWTFTPDEPLEDGEYTLTARAWLDGGDPELSESEAVVSFTVTAGGEDLPDTGSSSLPMILVGVGLLAAGGAALAIRARRNTTGA